MIDYEEDWIVRLLIARDGSVLPRAVMWSIPAMVMAALLLYLDEWDPSFREDLGLYDVNKSQIWAATTGVVSMMLGFRTRQAWGRFWEGTGLLHQMRGEWFDTVSNCVTFSIAARQTKETEVVRFRHAIVRIMSLAHGSALEEIAGNLIQLESIDTFGLDDATLQHVRECHDDYNFNKVEVMLHLLQSLITKALDDGVLKIPPPICSRVYQTISRGFVNLLNAKKIQDTKFPFPYAQLITFLLIVLEFLTPLIMSTLMKSKVLCVIFTFIPTVGLFCLNFVAQELENPFGTDENDLPLIHFQTEMNNCLMMLLHPNTDLIATVSDRCELDFFKLEATIRTGNKAEEPHGTLAVRHKTRRLSEFDINNPDCFDDKLDDNEEPMPPSPPPEKEDATTSSAPVVKFADTAKLAGNTPDASKLSEPELAIALANLEIEVGQEPVQNERQSPRMQEPSPMKNAMQGLSREPTGASETAYMKDVVDLQPVLAKSMEELIRSLQDWTRNVEREVDHLNENSVVLKGALKKFGEGLPKALIEAGPNRPVMPAIRQ